MTDTEPRNILPSRSERVEEVCASANPRHNSLLMSDKTDLNGCKVHSGWLSSSCKKPKTRPTAYETGKLGNVPVSSNSCAQW